MDEDQLIVFLKAPRPGAVKTRLAKAIGAPAAGVAYRQLVETLLNQLQGIDGVELCFTPDDAADEVQHWLKEGWSNTRVCGLNCCGSWPTWTPTVNGAPFSLRRNGMD